MTTNKEVEIVGAVGSLTWKQMLDFMISYLLNIKNEKEFLNFMGDLYNSMGTPKELDLQRRKLGLPAFTDDDLDKFEKLRDENE